MSFILPVLKNIWPNDTRIHNRIKFKICLYQSVREKFLGCYNGKHVLKVKLQGQIFQYSQCPQSFNFAIKFCKHLSQHIVVFKVSFR